MQDIFSIMSHTLSCHLCWITTPLNFGLHFWQRPFYSVDFSWLLYHYVPINEIGRSFTDIDKRIIMTVAACGSRFDPASAATDLTSSIVDELCQSICMLCLAVRTFDIWQAIWYILTSMCIKQVCFHYIPYWVLYFVVAALCYFHKVDAVHITIINSFWVPRDLLLSK